MIGGYGLGRVAGKTLGLNGKITISQRITIPNDRDPLTIAIPNDRDLLTDHDPLTIAIPNDRDPRSDDGDISGGPQEDSTADIPVVDHTNTKDDLHEKATRGIRLGHTDRYRGRVSLIG